MLTAESALCTAAAEGTDGVAVEVPDMLPLRLGLCSSTLFFRDRSPFDPFAWSSVLFFRDRRAFEVVVLRLGRMGDGSLEILGELLAEFLADVEAFAGRRDGRFTEPAGCEVGVDVAAGACTAAASAMSSRLPTTSALFSPTSLAGDGSFVSPEPVKESK